MIDPATGWIGRLTAPFVPPNFICNKVELAWLTCYPLPSKVKMDKGNEIREKLRKMIIMTTA